MQQAAEHSDTTQIACDTVASVVSGTAEARLLAEDVNIFRTLASGARELAAEMEKGILPPEYTCAQADRSHERPRCHGGETGGCISRSTGPFARRLPVDTPCVPPHHSLGSCL